MPAKKSKAQSAQKGVSETSHLTGGESPVSSPLPSPNTTIHQTQQLQPIDFAPNPAEDDAKREQLFGRFYELKGEIGDVFIEIEEAWRRCLDWEELSKDPKEKEAWEHSRKAWDRFYMELRWDMVFHNFGFLPTKHRKQFLKNLNQEYCKARQPTRGKRGRPSVKEDESERFLMTKITWWNFVQDVSLEAAMEKLIEQGVSFYSDQAHKTQYVTQERKRAIGAIYETLCRWGLTPGRFIERMGEFEMREGVWYAKEDLEFSTCRNLKEVLSKRWVQKELLEEYGLPFSDDPSTNLELAEELYFLGLISLTPEEYWPMLRNSYIPLS